MALYYFMVNEISKTKADFSLVRRIKSSYKTATIEREKYERELNDGLTYKEVYDKVLKKEKPVDILNIFKSVVAIPYSQARDYTSFLKWKCNRDIKND